MTGTCVEKGIIIHEFSIEIDSNGYVVDIDPQGLSLLGYSKEDIKSGLRSNDLILDPNTGYNSSNTIKDVLQGKRLGLNLYVISAKSGMSFTALVNSRFQKSSSRLNCTCYVPPNDSKLTDLIWEHQKMFITVMDAIPSGLFMVNDQGMISAWNKAAEDLTGISKDNIIGRRCKEVFDCPNYENHCPLIQSKKEFSQTLSVDLNFNYKGQLIQLQKKSNYLCGADGSILGAIESFVDLTPQHKAETALSEARELVESVRKAKRHFMGNMNHEIRTPLNGILGLLNLILSENPTPAQLEYVKSAKRTTHVLMELINDILDFNIINKGDANIEFSGFSLSSVISSVISRQYELTLNKQVCIHSHIDKDVPDSILGDSVRLYQILKQLVGNGIKFAPSGEVAVRVSRVSTQTSLEDNNHRKVLLHFIVRDTGVGIPEDKLELIFESLSQVDDSMTRSFGGLGIGLNLVHRLVQLLDGRIWLESELGKGTTVHLVLPFKFASSIDLERGGAHAPNHKTSEQTDSCQEKKPTSCTVICSKNKEFILAPTPLPSQWLDEFNQLKNLLATSPKAAEALLLKLKSEAASANQPALAAILLRLLLALRREDVKSLDYYYVILKQKISSGEFINNQKASQRRI